jgi:hypothetical protein
MTNAGCLQKDLWPAKECDAISTTTDSTNAKALCVERKGSVDFISMATNLGSDGQCASGFTECGESEASDPDRKNTMCVPSDLGGCPVMDISGTAGLPEDATNGGSLTISWSKVPTQTNKLPISELLISVGSVCKNDNNNAKEATNVGSYPLRVTGNNNQGSCEGGTDSTFVSFVDTRYTDFLEQNQAFPPADPKWDDLKASYSATEDISFYKRPYIPLKKQCRARAKEMEDNDNEVDQMRSAQLGLLVVAILVAVIVGFIIAIMDACLLLHKNGICRIQQKKVDCMKACKGKKECISMTLKIINACFLLWAVLISSKTKDFFTTVAGENCFEEDNNVLLRDFSSQVETFVYKKNLNALISFIVAMLITLIKLGLKCCKKKKDKKTPTNEQMKPGQIVPMNSKPKPAPGGAPAQTPNPSHMGNANPMGHQPAPPMGMAPQPPMQPAPMMGGQPQPPMMGGHQPMMMQQPIVQPVIMQPVVMQPQPVVYR